MRIRGLVLAIVLVFAVAFIGVVSVLNSMVDPTDNTDAAIAERDASVQEAGFVHLIEGLASASDDGVAYIHLDEYDVNELLYSLRSKIKFGVISARSIYIEEDGDGHRIFLPLTVFGVKTLFSGDIKLSDENGKTVCAEISNIQIGRISIDSDIISFFNLKEVIVSALSDLEINASFNADTLNLRITRETIGALIAEGVKDESNAGLINAMYSLLMVRTNAVTFDIVDPFDMGITVDLSIYDGDTDSSFTDVNGFTKDLLDREVIDESSVALVSKYYVNGYDRLNSDEQTAITELLSGEPDASQIAEHSGLVERERFSLVSLLITQFESNTDYLFPGFKIADRDINSLLSNHDIVGTVWQFVSHRDNSCAFVAVKNVYCVISDNTLKINLDLDLNGYVLNMSADFITGESPLAAISGTLSEMCIGGLELDENEVGQVFGFLCSMLGEGWITADSETKMLTLDFTSAFEESPILYAVLSNSKNIVTVCKESSLTDGGFAQITFTLFYS